MKRWISIGAVFLVAAAGTTLAGIQGTGFRLFAVIGTVDAGGDDLVVSGIRYDTSHAHVTVDGRPGHVSQVRRGHIVTIQGSVSSRGAAAIADEIVLESDVRGEVSSVDLTQGVISVLGQTIQVTDESVLDPRIQPNDLSGITRGTWVKVSAYQRPDGRFTASRVNLDLAPGQLQVRGAVRALDSAHQTLRVGGLTVDYSSAKIQGAIAEGAVVLARGVQTRPGGPLFATSVDVFNGIGHHGGKGDVQGIVTTFASAADFEVDGQPVSANAKTVYVLHGRALGADLPVRVTGHFDATGVLIARKIQTDSAHKNRR